ncbi:terminase large subunit domain-containing protein [Marinibactrum halimedae]|uniref:Terminase n=1 Tax=Marinibactrum halimedae TaxID=1444977 RepID=A0AA37WPK3_9GAMM|nr:terminase family protein [Marinibactrum halimedae]MCD9458471.1 terminase family protein [Marinibactrum halimedae]GLS26167.1 hypothetical protein GCM10007877_18820 [Marinibactrum halimedae]
MPSAYSPEIRRQARQLYIQRYSPEDIAKQLGINSARTIYYWAKKEEWENHVPHKTLEELYVRRITLLVNKPNKTDADYREHTFLSEQLLQAQQMKLKDTQIEKEKAIIEQIRNGEKPLPNAIQNDLKGEGKPARKEKRKRKVKNDISHITEEQLTEIRNELFQTYQLRWYDNKHHRNRFILKSRQIGATYYFSWEALEDAILSGENQVFISASKKQAEIFKGYIAAFAHKYFDITLTGETPTLSNGAQFQFGSTNARTVQGYNGHLYVDEVFWIPSFKDLNKVIKPIASQKHLRKTYFSTPSVESHGAFPLWSGDEWKNRPRGKAEKTKREKVEFDLSHATLKEGHLGPDKIWRNIVTIEDAIEQGCDRFSLDDIKEENTAFEYDQLYLCKFMREGESVFKLDSLLACAANADTWTDFNPKAERPFTNFAVWLGYDPARRGDKSMLVIVAPPGKPGKPYRVLDKMSLSGSWENQAARIQEVTQRYQVDFIGVDSTGPGMGVSEKLTNQHRNVLPLHYSQDLKTELVLRAQGLIDAGLLKWPEDYTDIAQGFLQIRQEATKHDNITYVADRNKTAGHADAAWAIMNALANQPLTGPGKPSTWHLAS